MKTRAYTILACLLTAGLAHAGFRHPVDDTGTEAQQIQNTPHPQVVVTSAKRVMPDRVVSAPAAQTAPATAAAKAAPRASFVTRAKQALLSIVKGSKGSAPTAPATTPTAPQTAKTEVAKPMPAPKAAASAKPAGVKSAPAAAAKAAAGNKPAAKPYQPAKAPASKSALRGRAEERERVRAGAASPVPKAPALPAAQQFNIPDVSLPNAKNDGLIPMGHPDNLHLKGLNRPQIYAFLKHARDMKSSNKDYTTDVRSRAIAEHYKAALHPEPGKSFRTPYKLMLAKVGKIQEPPAVTQYENMVKRIDSLFLGLDYRYARAVTNLWQLAESSTNARELQSRDALFAGILSDRAGWETTAAMMLEEAASKRVEHEDRYLKILWGELENVKNPVHLDKIVAAVSPLRVRDASPAGDQANFALAKRLLLNKHHTPLALYPSHEVFQQRIASRDLRDKLSLLALMGQLRSKKDSVRQAAVAALRVIETNGNDDNQQEARLALARTLLQHGDPAEAVDLYRNVRKDRKNRLAVLGEQTYAEYVNGDYQGALGKTVALETPVFRYGFSPDVHLVEIMTRKAMCDFGGAEAGVQRFADRYAPELHALENVLSRKEAPASYYEELVGYADSEHPYRFQRYLLQLPAVMENQKTMNKALEELDRMDQLGMRQKSLERPEGWDKFTTAMRDRWTARAQELRRGSGKTALDEMAYLAQRLRHTFAQVELLDLDISTGASRNYDLQSALNFPAKKQEAAQITKRQINWPFDQEIWEDEVDYMKAKNPSKCAVTKTASL